MHTNRTNNAAAEGQRALASRLPRTCAGPGAVASREVGPLVHAPGAVHAGGTFTREGIHRSRYARTLVGRRIETVSAVVGIAAVLSAALLDWPVLLIAHLIGAAP